MEQNTLGDHMNGQSPTFPKLSLDMDLKYALHVFFVKAEGHPFYTNRIEVVDGLLSASS